MRQALADALQSFEGALLVISHDRVMLRTVVDELWLVSDGGVKPFDDDLDGYARWLAARGRRLRARPDGAGRRRRTTTTAANEAPTEKEVPAADERVPRSASVNGTAKRGTGTSNGTGGSGDGSVAAHDAVAVGTETGAGPSSAERRRAEAQRRSALAPLRREVEREERALGATSARLETLRERLSAPELYNDEGKEKLAALLGEEADARRSLESIEEALLAAMERLELAETGHSAR